jgi:hypothetical protein
VADKPRTPKPPRPVQAPKVRSSHTPRQRGGGDRKRLWIALGAALVVLAAIGGGIAFAMSQGGDEGGGPSASGACQVEEFKGQGQKHVEELAKAFSYNSFPPTSGPHYPQPLIFGEYTEPLEQIRLVHNLEHGGVGVQYGADVPEETIAALTAWYRVDPRGLVLAPLPDVPEAAQYADDIVLTAWVADRDDPDDPSAEIKKQTGYRAVCSTFDEGAFDDFLSDHRARGPELFLLDQLAPGS